MLDAEQTIRLLDAGFTKEEIEKLGTGNQNTGELEKANESSNDAGAEKPEDNNAENAGTLTKDDLDPFRAEIDELKKTIKALQVQNTKNDSFTPPQADNMIADLSKNF